MNVIVSITDFRTNLFRYVDRLKKEGGEVIVEKDGKSVIKITPYTEDAREQAERMRALSKKLVGKITFSKTNRAFFRGKKEIAYMEKLGSWSQKRAKSRR